MKFDSLADRMKYFEQREAGQTLMPRLPICLRLDGRSFSKFTKGLERPYDSRLSFLMIEVLRYLVKETTADIGYTQSDEISLILLPNRRGDRVFGDKIQKLCSVFAGAGSAKFMQILPFYIPEKYNNLKNPPHFDCRAWNVTSMKEAANVLRWRQDDAIRNSVAMAAQNVFSHKTLQGKNTEEMKAMLLDKGFDWNAYPEFFKSGTFIRRESVMKQMSDEEWNKIPEKHRPPRDQKFERHEYRELELPGLLRDLWSPEEELFNFTYS